MLQSTAPSAQREAASKDLSRMQVRRLVILVDESQNVEFFQLLDAACLMDASALCVCDMGVYVGVRRRDA